MRHNKKFNHLSRKKAHRDSLLANMATSLIFHKRIFTTLAKAKALRVYVEPLITRSRPNNNETTTADMVNRRVVFSYLHNKEAIKELFNVVGPKIGDRQGGYTRILKTGNRLGDNAKMCFIELVDFNEAMLKDAPAKKATRRSRRKAAPKADAAPAAEEVAQPINENPTPEIPENAE